jgi:hypothetical protein
MSAIKLSDVFEDLKRVAEIGALRYSRWQSRDKKWVHTLQDFYEDIYPEIEKSEDFDPMEEYGEFHIQWVDETFQQVKLSQAEQALIIAALEQYAQSKDYYFDFFTINRRFSKVTLWKFTAETFTATESTTHVESTRIQATLKVFIEVFGREP